MAAWSQRLSTMDATFLHLEDRTAHMHVGGLAVFEGPPPPFADVLKLIEARLAQVPRYRQRLAFVPLKQGRPVWVDEAQFDLEYHVRHTALPAPGGEVELKKLAGRLLSQQLDRQKPLWELWLVEGLGPGPGAQRGAGRDGRFAIVSKTHHCMVDGISGVDIATVLMDGVRRSEPPEPGPPWQPRPAPAAAQLWAEALRDQVTHPFEMARGALEPGSEPNLLLRTVAGGLKPLLGLAQLGTAPACSINRPIGPHRRFETANLDLHEVKRIKGILGGTVNDVILAVMAGALRRLFELRGETPPPALRVMVPVSVRTSEQRGALGNQITAVFCHLPVGEPDPVERLARLREELRGLKDSHQAVGALALQRLGDFAPPTLLHSAARVTAMTRFFNLVITNVPGPQMPLYLLGRQLLACYPAVPLAAQQTMVIGLLSYNGSVGVGLVGDADGARDLTGLATAIPQALAELGARAQG